MSFNRYKTIHHPNSSAIPIRWAIGLVWAIAIAVVLPYSAYITFIDLSVSCQKIQWNECTTTYKLRGYYKCVWSSLLFNKQCTLQIYLPNYF